MRGRLVAELEAVMFGSLEGKEPAMQRAGGGDGVPSGKGND